MRADGHGRILGATPVGLLLHPLSSDATDTDRHALEVPSHERLYRRRRAAHAGDVVRDGLAAVDLHLAQQTVDAARRRTVTLRPLRDGRALDPRWVAHLELGADDEPRHAVSGALKGSLVVVRERAPRLVPQLRQRKPELARDDGVRISTQHDEVP